jgi:four helix bundle protein
MLKSYRDLLVWQRAIELVVLVYRFSAEFPRNEIYGLTAQIRRASVSVPSNIAEGYGRGTRVVMHLQC